MSIPQHHFSTSFSSLSRLNSTRYSELAGKTQLCSSLPPSLHFPHPSFPSPLFLLPLPLPYLFPPTPLLPSPYPPSPYHPPTRPTTPNNPSDRIAFGKCPLKDFAIRGRWRVHTSPSRYGHVHSNSPPLLCRNWFVCVWNEWFSFPVLFF